MAALEHLAEQEGVDGSGGLCEEDCDPVGARIWALLADGHGLGDVVKTLVGEYIVTEAQLQQDVNTLAGELVTRGLVEVSP